jgi:uncharacterized protein|tara:strand:+ start:320 stop:490 length:171 start_codon:yes stop_codon:yes gene_type:complete
MKIKCPTCSKITLNEPKTLFFPFCSDKCKLIDLGDWANEQYSITGDIKNENINDEI